MKIVHLVEDPFHPAGRERHEVQDVCAFLASRFATFPTTARIYHQQVAESCDVTPTDAAGIAQLADLPGPFYVVVYPEAPMVFAWVAVTMASFVVSYLLRPGMPSVASRASRNSSPNNDLSDRQNAARVHGRIPDIYGTVRSTPDLLAAPYKVFENNREIEYAYLCVGRGTYDVSDVRDDTTSFGGIFAASAKVFGPRTSPALGVPQLSIGPDFTEPMRQVKRFTSVNGQELIGPNEGLKVTMRCGPPGQIVLGNDEELDLTQHFSAGASVTLAWRGFVHTTTESLVYGEQRDFGGTYTIDSVSERALTLLSPASINSAWTGLLPGVPPVGTYSWPFGTLSLVGDKWTERFDVDLAEGGEVWANVVAPAGLYKVDTSGNQTAVDVTFEMEVTKTDDVGVLAHTEQGILAGTSVDHKQQAATMRVAPPFSGPVSVRMRRVTNKNYSWTGQIQEEIQWRDLYSAAPVSVLHFGDVTTVQTRMVANALALAVKNRKLNMLVTRKLPARAGAGFTTTLYPTRSAADILCAVALDPRIGNRPLIELDLDSVYGAVAAVVDYFGTELAGEFSYTFDKDNLSFEETAAMIASAVFCTAYRRGSEIKLSFEKATADSTLLFNHRNKVPGSETRTFTFGSAEGYDGVEYQYVDPEDDALATYYLPADRSAVNPKKIESAGVRGRLQAHFQANRAWNRLRYQREATEFEALQEANLSVVTDRVLVADNTRPETQDGQIERQDGLELELSQPTRFAPGKSYAIFLQLPDGTTEAIDVTAGGDDRHVVLAHAPRVPLTIDPETYVQGATYQLVAADDPREKAFLVTEKEPQGQGTSVVRAVNYDARYYTADKDFVNGMVGEDGNTV